MLCWAWSLDTCLESLKMDNIERDSETPRRQRLCDAANAAFESLQKRPNDWQEELAERQLWCHTLLDGFEDDSSTAQSDSISSDR